MGVVSSLKGAIKGPICAGPRVKPRHSETQSFHRVYLEGEYLLDF